MDDIKTKVDDLDVCKLETVRIYLKKLSNVMKAEVLKKFNLLKIKVNELNETKSHP